MSDTKKSEGMVRPIIIGVATAVLTAAILSYLGIDKKEANPEKSQVLSSSSDAELRKRQAELEEKIQQLSKKDLAQRQEELDQKIRQAEEGHKTSRQARAQKTDDPLGMPWEDKENTGYPNISGMWQDPNTGASYQISQSGTFFTIKEFSMGVNSAVGEGTITGLIGEFSYTTLFGTYGSGRIRISPDGGQLTCSFTDLVSQAALTTTLYR